MKNILLSLLLTVLILSFTANIFATKPPAAEPQKCPDTLAKYEETVLNRLNARLNWSFDREGHHTLSEGSVSDLEVGSLLFPLIDKTITARGKNTLYWRLTHPDTNPERIAEYQRAVKWLSHNVKNLNNLRDHFKKRESSFSMLDTHYQYFERRNVSRIFAKIFLGSMTAAGTYFAFSGDKTLLQLASVTNLYLGSVTIEGDARIRSFLYHWQRVLQYAVIVYLDLFLSDSTYLKGISDKLQELISDPDVSSFFRKTEKVKNSSSFTKAIDALFHYTPLRHGYKLDIEKKIVLKLLDIIDLITEVDVLQSIATLHNEHSDQLVFPEILDKPYSSIEINEGHNPYLFFKNPSKSVPNSFALHDSDAVQDRKNFMVITGQEMGGKTSYIKMVGLLSLMAQSGFSVPAKQMAATPVYLGTQINVTDAIGEGKSYFDKETDVLLNTIRESEKNRRVLVLYDEIILGTNPQDREAIEAATIEYLSSLGGLYLLTTHDLSVTKIAKTNPSVVNSHVEELVDNEGFHFTYRVLPGAGNKPNALLVLKFKQFPQQIIDRAREKQAENKVE